MKKKTVYLVAALLLIGLKSLAENSVEIDLNNDTLISTEGIDVNYGDMKLHVLDLKREREKNMLYMDKRFTARIYNPTGRVMLRGENGEVDTKGKNGKFRDVFGYLEVGEITGAEYPNDKIYFGGEEIDYTNGNILMSSAWLTTDPKVRTDENPVDAGYFLLSKSLFIEPEKQITFKSIDFRRGEKSYLPFEFPWFRSNIRSGSEVPLFPSFGSNNDYGWNISWGALYGDKDSKYVGGFAPKFADQMGWLVGRWENWYKFDTIGETRLNIDDLLVVKKDSGTPDRYSAALTHNYAGENGNFQMELLNSTANMVPALDDIIKNYDFDKLGVDPVEFDKYMGFYTLDTSLKGLGKNKDISFDAKVKQVSNRDIYDLMVFDYLEDDSTEDYDLYTDLSLYKDNERYKVGGYYNEMRDMNPGDNYEDDASHRESYGFTVQDKKNKLSLDYDLTRGDKYRPLSFMDKNSDLTPWLLNLSGNGLKDSVVGKYSDYTLQTIPEYHIYDSESLNLKAGEYRLSENWSILGGFDYNFKENELALEKDFFRRKILNNRRDQEFNRYENIIYEKTDENRGYGEISSEDYTFTVGGGTSKEEIWDRNGYYNYQDFQMGEAYDKYTLESDFIDFMAERKNLKIGKTGELRVFAGTRYDKYTSGQLNDMDYPSGKEDSLRLNGGFDYKNELYSEEDKKIENELNYAYQGYTDKNIRLEHKENFHKVGDKISFDLNKVSGEYAVDYSYIERASTSRKEKEIFFNSATFNFAHEQSLKLYYGNNERFTDKNIENSTRRDFYIKNYGLGYSYGKHKLTYDNETIESNIWGIIANPLPTDDSREKIIVDRYGYRYEFKNKDSLSLNYTTGTDERWNFTENREEFSIDKKAYGVSYYDYGTRYDNRYSVGYGTNRYGGFEAQNNYDTNTYNLSYSFVDKAMDQGYLEEYAMREYDKDRAQLTPEDLDRIASLMKERAEKRKNSSGSSFNLVAPWKRGVAFTGDYTRKIDLNLFIEKNEERYKVTDDFLDSVQELNATISYSQRRIGMAYTYQKEILNPGNWDNSEKTDEHWITLNMKIGKPSEGYRLTTYAKFEDSWFQKEVKTVGNIGVELGKEFGYYEWSVGFLREYSYGNRDYEWRAALQFSLLTFPDKPIFGLGANRSSGADSKVSPEVYLFDGVKASDVEFD